VTKPSRPHGTLPAAFSATGQDVPPSPDVAAHGVAQLIGETVAYNITALLAPVLQRLVDVQERYACLVCAAKAKRIAVANAKAAAEDDRTLQPAINQSFTEGNRGPVCWACYDPGIDGPYEGPSLDDCLPAPVD
jgi:hypothetical protein